MVEPTVPWDVAHIASHRDLDALRETVEQTGECAVDTETDGLHWAIGNKAFMATFCAEPSTSWACYDPELVAEFLGWLDENKHTMVYHNAKFDLHMLRVWTGWQPPDGYLSLNIDDTMHGFRIQFPLLGAALKSASGKYVDPTVDIDGPQRLIHTWMAERRQASRQRIDSKWIYDEINFTDVPQALMDPYATQDAWLTLQCHYGLRKDREGREAIAALYAREIRLVKLLVHCELHGWPVDHDKLMEQLDVAQVNLKEALSDLAILAPEITNPGSTKQLAKYIYGTLKEPVKHLSPSGKSPATDESALADMEDREAAGVILRTRKWKRYKDKCTELGLYYAGDGAVHSELAPERAKTGRFGSKAPALQNCSVYKPDKPYTHVRTLFAPKPGTEWLLIDYSQIEMRIFAHYCQDEHLLAAIRDGTDLHSMTASRMYGIEVPAGDFCNDEQKKMRSFGKVLNFTIIYGGGRRKITNALLYGSAQNDPVELEEARRALLVFVPYISDRLLFSPFEPLAGELLKVYRREFPAIDTFVKEVQETVKSRYIRKGGGYVVNAFGREIPVGYEAAYRGVNYIVQGSAADLIKSAMVNGWDATLEYCEMNRLTPWKDVSLFMTIHDEILFEVPIGHAQQLAAHLNLPLTTWPQFSVPIVADYAMVATDKSWALKKGFRLAA